MPTSHSPRRSPRIGQTGAPATATTTTATTSAGTPKNVPGLSGGELQRPRTPKQPGLIPSGAPKPDRSGQDTDTTTAKFAALMERIATLERELQKARSGEGQDAAARDPVRNGSSGIGASGAANAPPFAAIIEWKPAATIEWKSGNRATSHTQYKQYNVKLFHTMLRDGYCAASTKLHASYAGTSSQPDGTPAINWFIRNSFAEPVNWMDAAQTA
ncbi:uncharacterized protein LOC121530367 [Drosophila eugracilis]|uniref:uncharacterized protein LOC121530367 n=1 Tax=Drosophila eugracilis TaxID=29029 RepID=UPI001BDA42FF|nr:uncharacterized protein LOC121530367 [Drosophila eugracilis]